MVMQQNATPGTQDGLPCRTLYIGVGGTGKDVLLRVRRWIFERQRRTTLPFVRFLYLDTDTLGKSAADTGDAISEAVAFRDVSEKVSLDMAVEEIKAYFNGTGVGAAPGGAKGVQDWLPLEVAHLVQSLGDGAGQIRAFGRLAFWHHADTFHQRAKKAIDELVANEPVDPETGATALTLGYQGVHPTLVRVVIVTSLAGGTGSGCFLDVATYVRQLFQGIQMNLHIRGVVVLPSVFHAMGLGNTAVPEVLDSNAYAAMKEMDYLLHPRPPARVGLPSRPEQLYFGRSSFTANIELPVFDQVWVVDSSTVQGMNLGDKYEPFNVVSDVLTLELEQSSFAVQMRTEFSNMNQVLGSLYVMKIEDADHNLLANIPLHVRYSGVGQASLVLDRDRLRNAAAFRLGQKVVRYMLGASHDVQQHLESVDRALDAVGLSVEGLWKKLLELNTNETMLDWWDTQFAKDVGALEEEVISLTQRVSSDPVRALADLQSGLQKANSRYRSLLASQKEQLLVRFDSRSVGLLSDQGISDMWGTHYKRIQQTNAPGLRDAIQRGMEERFASFLMNPVELGAPAVELLLERASARIETLLGEFERPMQEIPEPNVPEIGEGQAIRDAKSRVDEASLIPSVFFPFRQIATDVAGRELASAVQQEMTSISRVVQEFLTGWRACLLNRIRGQYARHVTPNAKETLVFLKGAFGEQQEIAENGGQKKSIRRTGLRLTLANYMARMNDLEKSQGRMADAFLNAERATRNQYFDKALGEENLLFERCLNIAGTAPKDREAGIAALVPQFFAEALLLSGEMQNKVRDGLSAVQIDAVREGMKAVIERAKKADEQQDRWRDVQRSLETFCFKKTQPLALDTSLDAALEMNQQSPGEQQQCMQALLANAKPLLRMSMNWPGLQRRSRVLVGTAQPQRQRVGQLMHQAGLTTNPFEHARGSLVVYQDEWAVPIVQLNTILAPLKASYVAHLGRSPTNCFLRHRERGWQRYPDVLVTNDAHHWVTKRDALKVLFEAILSGIIRYNPAIQSWTVRTVMYGRANEQPIGASLDTALEHVTVNMTTPSIVEVQGQINEQHERLTVPGNTLRLDAYSAAIENLLAAYPPLPNILPGQTATMITTVECLVAADLRKEFVCSKLALAHGLPAFDVNAQLPSGLQVHLNKARELGMLVEIPYDDPRCATRLQYVTQESTPA